MRLVKILSGNDPLIARVPELYEEAFPIEERTETSRLLQMIEVCPQMTFNAILDDNDDFAGMAVIWELGICRYLLYLAVLSEKRNAGLGAAALTCLKGESDLPIILEVELPTDNPAILNSSHSHADCILMLMSTSRLAYCEECQRRVVDIVYKGLHDYAK